MESLGADRLVVRVSFKDGKAASSYENFVTGFWVSGKDRAEVWGRPAALAVAKDGSLIESSRLRQIARLNDFTFARERPRPN